LVVKQFVGIKQVISRYFSSRFETNGTW